MHWTHEDPVDQESFNSAVSAALLTDSSHASKMGPVPA